ncbi:substrate-binding periplasmic protein [Neptunicella sp.]|uniref:substrate-binding periplasmic protein n=1 Tax=Neptunicella sp. TaxID=2125986 RepID=UPI003F68DABB
MRSSIILVFCWFMLPVYAAPQAMRILATPEMPFTFINDEHQIDGFAVDLAKGIQGKLNTDFPVFNYPWARLVKTLSNEKNVVALTVARTPERENLFHWITPIARGIHGLYALKQQHIRLDDIESVGNIGSIGVLRGDARETVLREAGATEIMLYNTWQQVVGALLKGRVNAIFFSSSGINYLCPENKPGCDQIENVFIYKVVTTYIAMSKSGTDPQTVADWHNAAEAFKHDKAFVRLTQRWIKYYKDTFNMDIYLDNGAVNVWKDPNLTLTSEAIP